MANMTDKHDGDVMALLPAKPYPPLAAFLPCAKVDLEPLVKKRLS
jgi:hypothetical protein